MIRSSAIGPGAAGYYLGIVAEGVEGPGRWAGGGAADLGLTGTVAGPELRAVLEGRHPFTGATLHVRPVKVRGVELTFQVAKSVSVLWAVGGSDVATHIDAGRTAALDAALSYLEDEALVVGATRGNAGMVGAVFPHRTSRSGDPHLHTHVIIANLGASTAGRWMAVDRLVLDKHLHTAGHLFEAHLRHELSDRLGLRFGPVGAGVAQVEGVPEGVCRRFSQRRLQVEAIMAAHGGSSAASARLAAVIDRPERHPGLAAEVLAPEWEARARAVGFDSSAVRGVLGRGRAAPALTAEPLAETPGLSAVSSFSRRDVLQAVCASHPDGIAAAAARRRVDQVLGSPGVVRLAGRPPLRRQDVVRTEQGRTVVVATDRERWTTRAELANRQRAAELAVEQRGRGRVGAEEAEVEDLLAHDPGLDPSERELLRGLARSRDGVQVVDAAAGPGTEQVLVASRRLWVSRGVRVMGAAPDGPAADRLESGTGIESGPLGAVLARMASLAAPVVTPTVLVVDRAHNVAPADLVRLLETACRAEMNVVLVGDPGRIPEVDRAGCWRSVADAVGSLRLERPGRGRSAEHDLSAGAEPVFRMGDRLALSPSPTALRDCLVGDWRSAWDGTPRTVMVAPRRADVEDLNARARLLLARDALLDESRVTVGGLEVRGGDSVVVAHLDTGARRLGWRPGQVLRVLPGATLLEGPGGMRHGSEAAAGVRLRWGYAATPYQAHQVGAREWLVLGAPSPGSPFSGQEVRRHYVVAGIEEGPGLAAGLARQDGIRQLVGARGRAAEIDPPGYLVAALGPPPPDPEGRRTWRSAAGSVEAYRERWGVADGRSALGPEPGGGPERSARQRAERQEVGRQLGAAALRLGHGRGPERDRGRDVGVTMGRGL